MIKGERVFALANLDVEKNHIEMHEVDNDSEMKTLIDKLCAKVLPDMSEIPPWRIDCINNKRGNSVLLMRVHHVVGDGIALIGAMSAV